jgi:hypothetical protein
MAADSRDPITGAYIFSDTGAPDIGVDPTLVSEQANDVGTRIIRANLTELEAYDYARAGLRGHALDTKTDYEHDGTSWRIVSAPLQSYNSSPVSLTLGNGTLSAKYARQGTIVDVFLELVGGSTTAASGNVIFALPFTAAGDASVSRHEGIGIFQSTSGTQLQIVARFAGGATAFNPHAPEVVDRYLRSGSHLSNSFPGPGVWTNSRLYLHFRYEATS